MLKNVGAILIVGIGIGVSGQAALTSLNAPVTLNGTYPEFTAVCPSVGLPQPAAGSIDNGVFQSETTCYQEGIHWQGPTTGDTSHSIAISFGGTFTINGAIVQADDNDTYELDYLGTDDAYHFWWSVPEVPSFGLVTRPNADQSTIMTLPTVDALGVEIFATSGDGDYAVSQVEVFGSPSPVPEPGTLGFIGSGLAAIVVGVRRKQRRR
jgi:hypothetical protein